ncbi:hypothetical protein WKI71_41525 [Streptomyces sp. MS1.AVA.1]|uniref:F5/8 type C domain-containing protein n=1 Tax=Streptomyces machairae TaxID=3134109 RepID=A0ABU8UU90_9ACTN
MSLPPAPPRPEPATRAWLPPEVNSPRTDRCRSPPPTTPTPAEFAVDGLDGVGVRGTGWRAAGGDPQWICVDLQALCEVESLRLTFEATVDDPPYVDAPGATRGTTPRGRRSCPVARSAS